MAFDKPSLIFLSLVFAMLSLSVGAQTYRNISRGTSLTALENGSFWASPSGDFAFGFQQIEKDGFLLAIWFNRIPEKTVVWSASKTTVPILAPKGSKIELSSDGWFQLNDPSGMSIWTASSSGNEVAYAAMLDTGNFVLVGRNSKNLWQSFDYPTDTILPGQVLNQPAQLVSRYLPNNYSMGRFMLKLQDDGNLLLYTTHFPTDAPNYGYWDAHISGIGNSVVFNQSGIIYVHTSNTSIPLAIISPNVIFTENSYQRAIIDYDGVFRHYIHPKGSSSSTRSRPMAWSIQHSQPDNICLAINQDRGNGGACGYNGICTFVDGMKSCDCPSGYSFVNPNDVMKGCKQNFVPQSCDETSSQAHLFHFIEMQNTNWPYSDYDSFTPVTEDWCQQSCLHDCYCAVSTFNDGTCYKKHLPLTNGRIHQSIVEKAFLKVRKDNSTLITGDINVKNIDRSKLIIIGSTLLGSSVFLNLLFLVAACIIAYSFGHGNHRVPKTIQIGPSVNNLRSFTYEELREGTNRFTEELGCGAFSTVYKGFLTNLTGNLVAVKKLKMVSENEKEFEAEVSAMGRTHHRNLVQLLGFCSEGEHRLLVYEFMSKGTLAGFLFKDQRPPWYQRVQIAIGIAKGLLYLHEECSTQIIHCDIKPQNVLLDDSYTAKISDFGLAKLLKIDQTVTTTAIRGTKGYVAAEWFKNKPITVKVDVYSYGVLLLELICCRKNLDMNVEDENKMVLIDWAYDCFQYKRFDLLVEDDKEAEIDMKRIEKYVMIAVWCIQEDPSLRPTMKQVVQMLEGSMDVSNPPDITSFIGKG